MIIETKQQAQEVVDRLSSAFRLPPVKIKWHKASATGVYWEARALRRDGRHPKTVSRSLAYYGPVILIGPRQWAGVEQTLVHEFAHHLEHFGPGAISGRSEHRELFYQCLTQVATVWYGSADTYKWGLDYPWLTKRRARDLS